MKKDWAELENQNLKWVNTSFWNNNYELRAEDGNVLACIRRRGFWRETAEVEAVGNRWVFEKRGIFRQRVIVRSPITGEEAAVFHYKGMGGGRLEYPDGRVFQWGQGNFWGTKWMWTNEDGEPLIGFKTGGVLKLNGEISLDPELESENAPMLLIFLGWYLINRYYEQAAASAAVAGG